MEGAPPARRWPVRRIGADGMAAIVLTVVVVAVAAPPTARAPRATPPPVSTQPAPLSSPGQPLTREQPVILHLVRMLTATNGWGIGADSRLVGVIRTEDGGQHWVGVSPAVGPKPPFFLVEFGDFHHAWVAVPGISGTTRTLTPYHTGNDGVTWEAGEPILLPSAYPPAAPLDPGMRFVDSLHGWITLAFQGHDPSSTGVGIYRTVDGGLHWQEVSRTLASSGRSTSQSLPIGCAKTGITFSDSVTGWATAHCADGSAFFYVTHDGGATWRPQALPPPAGYPADLFGNCDCGSLPPQFTSATDGVLMFKSPDLMYATHDRGVTWSAESLPTKVIGDVDFINGTDGWLIGLSPDPQSHSLEFHQLYVTHDGGRTWQGLMANRELAGPIWFVNNRLGWSLYLKGAAPQLLKTSDGGRTWQVLHPLLIVPPTSGTA